MSGEVRQFTVAPDDDVLRCHSQVECFAKPPVVDRDWHGELNVAPVGLDGRQIAFGPPSETLTPEVLEQTYGGGLLRLEGAGDGLAVIADHHHGHDH